MSEKEVSVCHRGLGGRLTVRTRKVLGRKALQEAGNPYGISKGDQGLLHETQ